LVDSRLLMGAKQDRRVQ